MSGDWGGAREALAARGIRPGARYNSGFWSNVRGGFQTGTEYEGFAQWWIHADLNSLFGWQGGSFAIDWYSYHGGQPSADLVGAFPSQNLSGDEAAQSVRFFEIFLQQTWGDGRFTFKAGQLAADTDFFVSEGAGDLLNGTFGFFGLDRSRGIAPFYPLAAPGAYFRATTRDARWEARVGVYTADPGKDESSNFGFDWSFDNGAFFLAEIQTHRSPFGRPGTLAIGVSGTTANLDDFRSGGTAEGSYGLYASLDQLLVAQTPERPGFSAFLRSYGVSREDRSTVHWYVDLGFNLTRPFRCRPHDVLSVGFAYLRLSDDYVASLRAAGQNVSGRESVLELTYRFQVTRWLSLQPDVQFFRDPHFSRRDATAIGLRAVVEL